MLCCQLSWLVIASCELICVKCEEILPKQLTINMKPTKLTNAICLNHPLNFNSMTVLRRWLINNNPHDNPQLWTHCLPPVDILLQSLACNTKCNPVAEIKKSPKNTLGWVPTPNLLWKRQMLYHLFYQTTGMKRTTLHYKLPICI